MLKLISPEYHQRIFGNPQKLSPMPEHLQHDLEYFNLGDVTDPSPDTELPIPENIPSAPDLANQGREYWDELQHNLGVFLTKNGNAKMPAPITTVLPGWSHFQGKKWTASEGPNPSGVYAVDVETGVYLGQWVPVIACVLAETGWYIWVNPGVKDHKDTEWLVPLSVSSRDAIGLAHNAGYERSYMAPQYSWYEESGYWFCTMSLVTRLRGMSNQQLLTWLKLNKDGTVLPYWAKRATMASLSKAAEVVLGEKLDKEMRDTLLAKGMGFTLSCSTMVKEGDSLFWRSGSDIDLENVSDSELEAANFDEVEGGETDLLNRFFIGQPGVKHSEYDEHVCQNPEHFLRELSNYCFKDVLTCVKLADTLWPEFCGNVQRRLQGIHVASFAGALLMSKQRIPLSGRWDDYFKNAEEKYQNGRQYLTSFCLALANEVCSQGPENSWWRQLDWSAKNSRHPESKWYLEYCDNPALSRIQSAILLKATYKGMSIRLVKEGTKKFWKYDGPDGSVEIIPHPSDPSRQAVNLISKELYPVPEINEASGQLLSCADWNGDLTSLFELVRGMSTWTSLRKRVHELHVVKSEMGYLHVPHAACWGTWTARQADRLWLVCSNPKENKIGSGLRSLIEAPAGWKFVGADFDSQELRLASLMGDAAHGKVGSTPLSVSVIAGEKRTGTDTHSVIAKMAGCSRDIAKGLVYGAVYGMGLAKGAQGVAAGAKVSMAEAEATAKKVLGTLKGGYGMRGLGVEAFASLTKQASVFRPATPILKNPISDAGCCDTNFMPSKVNWLIQSSGRDLLDLLMFFMNEICKRLCLEVQMTVTIHDQIYYATPEHSAKQVAYALALAHTYAWVIAFRSLGLDTLPKAYLVPESIDVDWVVRKTVTASCVTPDSPTPLLPHGQSYSPARLLAENPLQIG